MSKEKLKEYMNSVGSLNAPKFNDKSDFYCQKAKEPSGLEVLEKLKDRAIHDEYLFRQDTNRENAISFLNEIDNLTSIIEKELKEGEEYRLKYSQTHIALCKLREEKTKKEQALEIVGEKRVQVGDLLYSSCLEGYNKGREITYQLTQEEYDLLKEMLQ